MLELNETIGFIGCYRFLLQQVHRENPAIEITTDQQQFALTAALTDFDNHNRVVGFDSKRIDAIKYVSFLGCHLLTWLPSRDHRRAVAKTLVNALDDLVRRQRKDKSGLPGRSRAHMERLIVIEADGTVGSTSDIWGHGFWRVGLYTAFLTAASAGSVP